MILVDVNVLVYAARQEFDQHDVARSWLVDALNGLEPVVILDEVLASTIRLMTNHRVVTFPSTPDEALEFCRSVRQSPSVINLQVGGSRWARLERLVQTYGLRGNDLPDALLAATALDIGARLATFDRGFRRFAELDVVIPG